MSALRLPGPDGRTILVVIDDGCSPHHSAKGIRGGLGNPVLTDGYVKGESSRDVANRQTREYKAREAEKARERRAAR